MLFQDLPLDLVSHVASMLYRDTGHRIDTAQERCIDVCNLAMTCKKASESCTVAESLWAKRNYGDEEDAVRSWREDALDVDYRPGSSFLGLQVAMKWYMLTRDEVLSVKKGRTTNVRIKKAVRLAKRKYKTAEAFDAELHRRSKRNERVRRQRADRRRALVDTKQRRCSALLSYVAQQGYEITSDTWECRTYVHDLNATIGDIWPSLHERLFQETNGYWKKMTTWNLLKACRLPWRSNLVGLDARDVVPMWTLCSFLTNNCLVHCGDLVARLPTKYAELYTAFGYDAVRRFNIVLEMSRVM